MQKTTLALMMGASLLFATSACQPPADMPEKPDDSDAISTSTQTVKQPSSQPLIEAKTPRALTTALVELSEKQLTNKLVCTKLSNTMKDIDNRSKIEDIHAVQRQLNACLPIADNVEILQWLKDYQALYGRFLGSDDYMDYADFHEVVDTIEQGQKLSVEQLKALSPRQRYLTELVESKKADVSVLYVGEGTFIFHHNLKAMADLFIPYLPKDQAQFIQRMAKDNQNIFWNDAAIAVSFNEVVARAVFWENYIQRYPKGYFSQDAKYLLDLYRYVLFFGSDNTQWTDDAIHEFLEPEYKRMIMQLTKRPNSILAQDAQKFLNFTALSDSERQKKYPVPSKDDNGYKIDDWAIPRYQLTEALPIPSSWENNDRNCLSSVICVDYNVE
ncbi:hypothetical protein [Psychrobacter frigidicola]|uniref:hypothetical protein n=1 Tax=Psychrobacter frigidicola TaxID=45611 RepID=UPI00191B0B40|nr:hypothetical protein [Psychrobacter frigidicola]